MPVGLGSGPPARVAPRSEKHPITGHLLKYVIFRSNHRVNELWPRIRDNHVLDARLCLVKDVLVKAIGYVCFAFWNLMYNIEISFARWDDGLLTPGCIAIELALSQLLNVVIEH